MSIISIEEFRALNRLPEKKVKHSERKVKRIIPEESRIRHALRTMGEYFELPQNQSTSS